MKYLSNELVFPDPALAIEDGLLAVGGDLSMERLLLAYRSGIFPWYEDAQPILWWSPDPRMVLFPKQFKVSKSFKKVLRDNEFQVTFNRSFSEVIKQCAIMKRDGQQGTWITAEMSRAYTLLHTKGHAVSVEVWQEEQLVGGLYGIDLPDKKIFCGESMFSKVSEASKVAFYYLTKHLLDKKYTLIDCQMHTPHLESLGAKEISRAKFLTYLK